MAADKDNKEAAARDTATAKLVAVRLRLFPGNRESKVRHWLHGWCGRNESTKHTDFQWKGAVSTGRALCAAIYGGQMEDMAGSWSAKRPE
ncbi:Os01g0909700 [Oryza sativa Japonica Group]|uniref:Os01g0909700 protein n=1 Tax=Oryza sativa subsp. japonica TaxID=39947 RepID=A0A0P0VBU4_ORYSJ|nr:Os01g0909700 [Oryza sativa Japonica Group]